MVRAISPDSLKLCQERSDLHENMTASNDQERPDHAVDCPLCKGTGWQPGEKPEIESGARVEVQVEGGGWQPGEVTRRAGAEVWVLMRGHTAPTSVGIAKLRRAA